MSCRRIIIPCHSALLALLLAAGGARPCPGQNLVTLKSGRTLECKVLEFANGIYHLEFPDGTRRVTSQDNIARIQFIISEPEELAPEFGLTEAPPAAPEAANIPAEAVPEPPESPPSPAPPMTPAPAAARPAAFAKTSSRLVLASNWQLRLSRGNLALKDAARLFSKCGKPQIDLEGKTITIWGDITYLMPVQQAKKLLGLGISTRSALTCAAFAPNSFFCHVFPGSYEDGFNRLYLITDYADQVVGLQWQDNTSQENMWFPYSANYSQEWSLYNFVEDRRKGNPNWQVGFYVCQGSQTIMGYPPGRALMMGANPYGPTGVNDGVIRVDSDLYSVSKDRWNITIDSKSRQRNRLLLAQPIIDLMLYIVQNSK